MEKKDKMLKALDKNLPTSQKRQDYITKKDVNLEVAMHLRIGDVILDYNKKYDTYQNL